jgi:hypothetical protein
LTTGTGKAPRFASRSEMLSVLGLMPVRAAARACAGLATEHSGAALIFSITKDYSAACWSEAPP